MHVGRTSSLEVTLNSELIFSKLEVKGFPINEDIVDQVSKSGYKLLAPGLEYLIPNPFIPPI